MKSDKGFSEFIGNIKLPRVIVPLCIGIVLILLSGFMSASNEAESDADDSLAALCSSVDGVGRCYVKKSCTAQGDVCAVAVICDGANDMQVRSELFKLISSFYGIGYNRISVLKISN